MNVECLECFRLNWKREPTENHRSVRADDMCRRVGLAPLAGPARAPLRRKVAERMAGWVPTGRVAAGCRCSAAYRYQRSALARDLGSGGARHATLAGAL